MLNEIMNYDIETWKSFFEAHWLILAIAVVVLFIVVRVVKTVIKWLLVAAIVIGVLLYSGYTLEDLNVENLKQIGTEVGAQVAESVKKEAINAMVGEAADATYASNGDGTFTVKTANLELTGTLGAAEVEVSFRGAALGTWKVDDTIAGLIEQAKTKG